MQAPAHVIVLQSTVDLCVKVSNVPHIKVQQHQPSSLIRLVDAILSSYPHMGKAAGT